MCGNVSLWVDFHIHYPIIHMLWSFHCYSHISSLSPYVPYNLKRLQLKCFANQYKESGERAKFVLLCKYTQRFKWKMELPCNYNFIFSSFVFSWLFREVITIHKPKVTMYAKHLNMNCILISIIRYNISYNSKTE